MQRVVQSRRAVQRRFRVLAESLSGALECDRSGYPPVVDDTVPAPRSCLDYIRTCLLGGKVIKIVNSLRHLCEERGNRLPDCLHGMIRVDYKNIIPTWGVHDRR